MNSKPIVDIDVILDSIADMNMDSTLALDHLVDALIEIPVGTIQKWELNKASGQIQWEMVDGQPRYINYLGYPGNYGMIPKTLLSKDNGGDGDPLDVLVLGPAVKRGTIIQCKIIGVLYLNDRGERDDKLIAIAKDSPLFEGIAEIIKLWFTNYKGHDKITSMGYGDKNIALDILQKSLKEYRTSKISLHKY